MAQLLIAPVAVCSQAEFEGLLAQQMQNLHHLALRYTRSSDLANDLVHDTVVRALTFRIRFAQGSNFGAWIRTVLTNTFLHGYRRQKREKEILGTVSRFDVLANLRSEETRRRTREPEKSLTEGGFDDSTERALASLPADFRAAVKLCDVEGLSYKDASKQLECPIGTVMSRLHRGRRLLKRDLGGTAAEHGIGRQTLSQANANVAGRAAKRPLRAPRRAVVAMRAIDE